MDIKTCKHCDVSFSRADEVSIPHDRCERCHGEIEFFEDPPTIAPQYDPVASPAHYQSESGIECIDAIRAALTPEEFRGYCKGNVFKYLWRHERKNGVEDVRKSQWYLERLTKELEKLHKPIIRESDEWIPNNGEEPDLPDGTRVDIKFADGIVFSGRSARNWVWAQNGSSVDITHYRIHRPE